MAMSAPPGTTGTGANPNGELNRPGNGSGSGNGNRNGSRTVGVEGLSGGIAGAVEALLLYPTDYVKTQLQLQRKSINHAGGRISTGASNATAIFQEIAAQQTAAVTGAAPARAFTGPLDVLTRTVRERGVFALYRGLSPQIVGSVPKAAIRFAAYEYFASRLDARSATTKSEKVFRTALAGGLAGAAEALIAVTPMETVKTQLVADANSAKPKYKGLVHGVSTMLKENGVRGVYRGTLATTLKQSGNQMTRFVVFEELTSHIVKYRTVSGSGAGGAANGGYRVSSGEAAAAGAIAGLVSVYATMPFDVVKTRLQSTESGLYGGSSAKAARHVYREYGVTGFWRGTVPRLARVSMSSTVIFAVQNAVKQRLYGTASAGSNSGSGGGGGGSNGSGKLITSPTSKC